MTRASPTLLRLAVVANAMRSPLQPHHRTALTARGYAYLLTEGESWFLGMVLRLPGLSDRQQARLNEIAVKVERGRK